MPEIEGRDTDGRVRDPDRGDKVIVVRDVASNHMFTYGVVLTPMGDRVLGPATVFPSARSSVGPEVVEKRVLNFAQMQMHEAGRIDSVFAH